MRVQGYVHIDLADPAPRIIDGYWHEWVNGQWVNTGVKAKGEDGETTQTVYRINNSETIAPSLPSGNNLYSWTANRQTPTASYRFEWSTQRTGNDKDGWTAWSAPVLVNRYVKDGDDGATYYPHFRYSQNSNGNPMTESPTNAIYVGFAFTTSPTAPTSYTAYKWSKIKGEDGSSGANGNGFAIRYLRAENRPTKPNAGVLYPSGWMTEIDNPINNDIYWPHFVGEWTLQSNGEYKSKPITHNENSPFRFNFFNRTAGSDLRITVRTSSESYDKIYVGKLDEELGANYSNARLNFGGTQSQELTYALPSKGEHYILFDYKKDGSVNSGSDAAFVKIDFPIQKVWMIITNVTNGVAGTWSEPSLFIDNRIEETIAATDRSKAITDKFGTTIDGGLVQTVMMLLREANTQTVTAGISGIQGINKNRPAFWAGGDSDQAIALIEFLAKTAQGITPDADEYSELAKIIMLHNGAAKMGILIIEEGGVAIVDPSTGKPRIVFSQSNIPTLSDLMSSVGFGDYVNTSFTSSSIQNYSQPVLKNIPGSIVIDKDGSDIRINSFSVNFSCIYSDPYSYSNTYYGYEIHLWRNGSVVSLIDAASVDWYGRTYNKTVDESVFKNMPAGTYRLSLRLYAGNNDNLSSYANIDIGSSRITWSFTQAGIRYFQFGLNGMMAFFSDNHMYFTENGGLDLRGKTNMPGVLAKGRILSGGSRVPAYAWGAKNSTASVSKPSGTGSYRVPVNCPNGNYDVNISPRTANRTFYTGATTSTYFDVYFRDHNGNAQDSEFSYTIVGANY